MKRALVHTLSVVIAVRVREVLEVRVMRGRRRAV